MGAYLVWYAPVLVVGLIIYNSFLDNSPGLYIRDKTLRVPLHKRRRSLTTPWIVEGHSLKYERKYYKVGEGRAAITEDKISDENARLLTMVAIAKELSPKNSKVTGYKGISMEKEEMLPEYSEELPKGMESVLEQFM